MAGSACGGRGFGPCSYPSSWTLKILTLLDKKKFGQAILVYTNIALQTVLVKTKPLICVMIGIGALFSVTFLLSHIGIYQYSSQS